MPRYFFHLYDDTVTPDPEGLELPDIEMAVAVARSELRQLAAHELQHYDRVTLQRIEIADESGRVLETVYFDDINPPAPPTPSP